MGCLLGGLFLTLAYSWLLDDAYIYFKYVDNWVLLGRGLVYNPGEYAEGYTSPLWLLLLAALRSLGLGYWFMVRAIGVLSFAVFWLGCVVVRRRLAPAATPILNLPLLLLAFNYAVLSYFTSGTESPLVALEAVAYALFLLGSGSRTVAVAVGLSPLVRPELALALLLAIAWSTSRQRALPRWTIATAATTSGAWLLFRILYYADLFPTTFYLKMRIGWMQGFRYLHDTFAPYHFYLWLALGILALVMARRRGMEEPAATGTRLVLVAIAGAMALYVVNIGGDARHFRYLAFPVCLGVLAFGGLAGMALGRVRPAVIPLVAMLVALSVLTQWPRQATRHPFWSILLADSITAREPVIVDGIADAEHHRRHPELPRLSPWGSGEVIEMRPLYDAWRQGGGADPPKSVNAEYLCWYHYRHFDQWSVHGFGLTDVLLARSIGGARADDRPGHRMSLLDRAREEAAILSRLGLPPHAGTHRAAVEAGIAPDWVRANLPAIEMLERKIYGPRDPWESLALATHVGERVDLDARVTSPAP